MKFLKTMLIAAALATGAVSMAFAATPTKAKVVKKCNAKGKPCKKGVNCKPANCKK